MKSPIVAIISLAVNGLLTLFKLGVGFMFGSMALIAEGIHSGLDIISSLITFVGIRKAAEPADKEHPYGHERYEVIAAFLIAILLFVSAVGILYEVITNIIKGEFGSQFSFIAIIVMAFSLILNEIMARIKFYFGNKNSSLALVADAEHSRVDAISSLAILIGLFLIKFYPPLDSILALLVALYIGYEAWIISKEAINSLVDFANPRLEEEIRKVLRRKNLHASEIKSRKIGSSSAAEVFLICDPQMKINQVSQLIKNLEQDLLKSIDELKQVFISVKSHEMSETVTRSSFGERIRFRRGAGSIGPDKKGTRIIVPLEDDEISSNEFGSSQYLVIDIDKNSNVIQREKIKNPYFDSDRGGHGTKFAVAVSADKVIIKILGENARKNLEARGIIVEQISPDKKIKDLGF